MGVSRAAFRALLLLYPSDFRRRFGAEMVDVFSLRYVTIRSARGRGGIVALWARTLPGVVCAAFLERADAWRDSPSGATAPGFKPYRLPQKDRNPMDRIGHDFRYGLRTLARSPGFTAVAVLTLGLGIGINTAVFSLVNALLFRPLPHVQKPSRLAVLFSGSDGRMGVASYMDYLDFRERTEAFSSFAAFKPLPMDLSTAESTERIQGMIVTEGYFSVLGVSPAVGRFFVPEDADGLNAEAVAVLGYDFWTNAFGGDPDVLGRTVRLNGRSFDIIGVAPADFRGTFLQSRPAIFAPMLMQPHFMPSSGNLLDNRRWGGILTVGRLADGVTLEQAGAEFAGVAEWIHSQYPDLVDGREYVLRSLDQATILPGSLTTVVQLSRLLLAVVGLVLLVACVNIANLSLSRSLRRRPEMAVRRALGAGRARLARQLLIESVTLSSLGGIVGLAMALSSQRVLRSLPLPFELDLGIDVRILGFATAVSVLTGLVFGIVPALNATRFDLAEHMRGSSTRSDHSGRQRLTSTLVVAQVALSIVLLVGAGLFARTLINLASTDLGFDTDNVVVANIDPTLQGYRGAEVAGYYRRLLERTEAAPGVISVSLVNGLPGNGSDGTRFDIEGFEVAERPRLSFMATGPRYFETLGISMLAGRDFRTEDELSGEAVVIINQSAADTLRKLTGRAALGTGLRMAQSDQPFARVIGVAADSKTASVRADPVPMIYVPHAQVPGFSRMTLLARTGPASAVSAVGAVRQAIRDTDPDVPAVGVMTLGQYLDSTLGPERLAAGLLTFSAMLALVLASIGLYGVLSYNVGRRRGELGIRMALGAQANDVRRMVVNQGMALVLIGTALGLAGAAASGSLVAGFLFGISSLDGATFVAVIALLALVAWLASYIPARRATRVDPITALRSD